MWNEEQNTKPKQERGHSTYGHEVETNLG